MPASSLYSPSKPGIEGRAMNVRRTASARVAEEAGPERGGVRGLVVAGFTGVPEELQMMSAAEGVATTNRELGFCYFTTSVSRLSRPTSAAETKSYVCARTPLSTSAPPSGAGRGTATTVPSIRPSTSAVARACASGSTEPARSGSAWASATSHEFGGGRSLQSSCRHVRGRGPVRGLWLEYTGFLQR
jgi:hypothetical protein